MVLLTSGFPLSPEFQSEVTAVIDTCNKANVAIYPIDVRGLVASDDSKGPLQRWQVPFDGSDERHHSCPAAFHYSGVGTRVCPQLRSRGFCRASLPFSSNTEEEVAAAVALEAAMEVAVPAAVAQEEATVAAVLVALVAAKGTAEGPQVEVAGWEWRHHWRRFRGIYNSGFSNPNLQPRQIVPQFPPSASDNQQVLYQLADGTGGFVILNSNDLLNGLQRIANDQNQYYLLAYKPAVSTEGACHTLKVKVDRGGTNVRARSGYCNAKPVELLAGNPIEKDLEVRGRQRGEGQRCRLDARTLLLHFSPNTAQIHLAVEIPSAALKFEKVRKGKQHAAVNLY